MSDLLNTSQAAELLGVSEASVRRWSSAGLLSVQRVGPRGNRRYRRQDLLSFLQRQAGPAQPPLSPGFTVSGMRLESGAHLAVLYDRDGAGLELGVPFLRAGLETGEACYLGAPAGLFAAFLAELGVEVAAEPGPGRLLERPPLGPTVEASISSWERTVRAALGAGARGVRLVGEATSARRQFPTEEPFFAYEVALNTLARRFPITLLCLYDLRDFSGPAALAILKSHPDLALYPLGRFLLR